MAISFNLIPSNIRTPGVFVEIDNSRAMYGLQRFNTRILVIGQRLSTGTVAANVPTLVSSVEQAKTFFGTGSMLANQFKALKANNKYIETWAIALSDNGAGTAAAGAINFTGSTPTAAGTLNIYVAGVRVQVAVATTDTAAGLATKTVAAINELVDLPVTAAVNGSDAKIVDVTARHKGEVGNDIDIRLNYLGEQGGERTPAGVAVALTQPTGGATNPSVSTAIAALPDEIYDYWTCPYTDSSNLTALKTELDDRWGPLRALEGHLFCAKDASVGSLSTFGNSHNSPHVTCLGLYDSPTPSYEVAAAMVAQVGYSATIDPARPFQTLELRGVYAPPEASRFLQSERNTLLYDGVSTYTVSRSNAVLLERIITTYQTNAASAPDASYLDYNTMATLAFLRQSLRSTLSSKFPRHKIVDNGTRFGAGQAIATPNMLTAEIVALFSLWEANGLVEDLTQFKNELIVERDSGDPNRVNIQLPPNLVNQLNVIAAQIQYLL